MRPGNLRGEHAQAVGRLDLHTVDEVRVGRGGVDSGLTRHAVPQPGFSNQLALARPEQPARVAEGLGLTLELPFELDLRSGDFLASLGVVDLPEIGMGPAVRLESQDAGGIHPANLPPTRRRSVQRGPAVSRFAVDHRGGDEDGCGEAVLGEHGVRIVEDVPESVVERERDGSRLELPRVKQIEGGHGIQGADATARQVLHLGPELRGTERQRVGIVADPVVEEDAQRAIRVVGGRPPGPYPRLGEHGLRDSSHVLGSRCVDEAGRSRRHRKTANRIACGQKPILGSDSVFSTSAPSAGNRWIGAVSADD